MRATAHLHRVRDLVELTKIFNPYHHHIDLRKIAHKCQRCRHSAYTISLQAAMPCLKRGPYGIKISMHSFQRHEQEPLQKSRAHVNLNTQLVQSVQRAIKDKTLVKDIDRQLNEVRDEQFQHAINLGWVIHRNTHIGHQSVDLELLKRTHDPLATNAFKIIWLMQKVTVQSSRAQSVQ